MILMITLTSVSCNRSNSRVELVSPGKTSYQFEKGSSGVTYYFEHKTLLYTNPQLISKDGNIAPQVSATVKDSFRLITKDTTIVKFDTLAMNKMAEWLALFTGQNVNLKGRTLNFIVWVNGVPTYRSNPAYEPPVRGVRYTIEWDE